MKKTLFIIALSGAVQLMGQSPFDEIYLRLEASEIARLDSVTLSKGTKQDSVEGFRQLFFIHGLGGNGSAWSRVVEACMESTDPDFPARNCEAVPVDYDTYTNSSLKLAAQGTLWQIRQHTLMNLSLFDSLKPSRSILIGHSQGGLVGRTLIHKSLHDRPAGYGPDFGGFINVAGPLGGAAILNNRDMILDMASHACGKFLKAELSDRKVVNWIFKKLVGDDLIASGCESMGESILPLFFQKYFDPITEHYKVGAPFLDSLKKDANHEAYRDLPKITFYCVEPRERIFWRTLSWMAKDPNGPGFFEANHDFGFYEENMAGMYLRYQASLQESLDRLNYLYDTQLGWGWIPGLNIALMLNVRRHAEKADAMRNIVEWFDGVHSEWEAVIGASEYVWVLDTCYVCTDCTSGKRRYCKEEGCCAELGCARSSHGVLAGYRTRIYENDGVVTAPSASDLPYQTWMPVRVYPNEHVNTLHKGSSHMQVRNDEGIKEHLNNALNGEYGEFFYTKRKGE